MSTQRRVHDNLLATLLGIESLAQHRLGFVLTEPARTRLHLPASYSSAHYVPQKAEAGDHSTNAPQRLCKSQCRPSTVDRVWLITLALKQIWMQWFRWVCIMFSSISGCFWIIKPFSTTQVCQPFLTQLHNKEQMDVIAWLGAKSDETDSVKVAMGAGNEF